MPKDFVPRSEVEQRLTSASVVPWRPAHEILRAAREILARHIVPVRARRPNTLTSERIEHLLTDRSFEYHSMVSTDCGFFVDACIEWPKLIEELAVAGIALVDEASEVAQLNRVQSGRQDTSQRNQERTANRQPLRGPNPGATGFATADEALFPEIEQLRKDGTRSVIAAARTLANEGKVVGAGAPESRATRLARRFGKHKSGT
jgi:hypothetical protein